MKKLFIILIFVIGLIATSFFTSCHQIGQSVHSKCQLAQSMYSGDCVDALISFLTEETNPLSARKGAVWALGQLGDPRATPILENLPTIADCYDSTAFCDYEVAKALKLTRGGFNATAFFWR